jgi:signal transduction histidine kinase
VRRPVLGLRARLVAALVLTSAVTLGVAALAILSPLQQRLRRDTGTTLVVAAGSARSSYADLLREPLAGRGHVLRHLNASLARRTGAAATLVLSPDGVVVTSDADAPAALGDATRAIQRDRTTRSVVSNVLVVASPLRVGGRQYAIVLRKRLTEVSTASRVVRRAYLAAAIAGLLAALVLGIGLSSALLRRLRRLHRAVLAARADGTADPREVDPGRDEIGELSRAFAGMQEDVRRQEAARRAFVATASHELRTPVASLQTTLELLVEDLGAERPDLADAREQVRLAHGQAHRLGGLAADLLDLSRLDAEVELRAEPVEMVELARAVAAEFAVPVNDRDAPVEVELDGAAWARGDPGAIARILRILIENAVRFAPPGTPVRMAVHDGEGCVTATVTDEGPGVVAEERELIFERFRRGARTGDAGGFGLGLAIGREMAGRLGGDLALADPSPGRGARFVLRLPAA